MFMEHVAAEKSTWTWTMQGIADPFHRLFGDGCRTRRDTEKTIKNAGFKQVKVERFMAKAVPFWLKPFIMGVATK